MHFRRLAFTQVVLTVFLAALSAWGGFVICAKCGYENNDARRTCYHCQATLPQPDGGAALDQPMGPADASEATVAGSNAAIVDEEIEQGLSYLEKNDAETARLFFRNATALNLAVNTEGAEVRSERILALLKQSETSGMVTSRECAVCGGAGMIRAESTPLVGGPTRLGPGHACTACRGTGRTAWRGTVDDRKYARGRALQLYGTLQQSRRMVPVGDAWLPAGLAADLSVTQRVRIKRAVAAPCRACLGFGLTDCRKCKGLGRVDCPERDCVKGYVTTDDGGSLTKSKMRQTRKCPVCGGNGWISCRDCVGRGSVLCAECNGTGDRAVCRQCGGEGLRACRRCAGSGRNDGAMCETCMGAGVVECSSCNGDGRRK